MLDTDLVEFLRAAGTLAGQRVFTGDAEQDCGFPAAIIRRISGLTPRTLRGVALFSRATFTVDCIGLNYSDSLPLANEVRALLDGFKGTLGQTRVASARCLAEPADFSEVDGDLSFRRVSQDFLFVYVAS